MSVLRQNAGGGAGLRDIASPISHGTPAASRANGLRAVVESRVINHERLPMLEVVFERFVRAFSTAMRNLTSDAIEIYLEELTSVRFSDFMIQLPPAVTIGVLHVPAWANYGLATADRDLVYAVIDALLGGRHGAIGHIEGRGFTSIEINLVARMFRLAFSDLSAAFQPIAPVEMLLDRMETNPKFAAIASPSDTAVLGRMRVDMDGRGGTFSILLPYATLEPVRGQLVQRFMGEKTGSSSIWQEHMARELARTMVDVELVLGEKELSIDSINRLTVGQTLAFNVSPDDALDLRCRDVQIGLGQIGQRSAHVAVRLLTTMSARTGKGNEG